MMDIRKTVLQGEILCLLHDIGKLSWPFVSRATGVDDGIEHHDISVTTRHTLLFLANANTETLKGIKESDQLHEALRRVIEEKDNLPALQKRLLKKFDKPWVQVNGQALTCLGSLIALHHQIPKTTTIGEEKKTVTDFLLPLSCQGTTLPDSVRLAQLADTSESMFSKGQASDSKKSLLGNNIQQKGAICLARPQGGVENTIDKNSVDSDRDALASDLTAWANEDPSGWDEKKLAEKRDALRVILKKNTAHNLAETRIPYNDVSLWQHCKHVSDIFKPLLASHLLSGDWTDLTAVLQNEQGKNSTKLLHARQKLAMLYVQWDDEAFLAKSVRPFEIVGRRARLNELANAIQKKIETDLCIGNEVYRDHRGICFLVPDFIRDDASPAEKKCLASVCESVEKFCNGAIIRGDLPWKIRIKSQGLLLTGMLSLCREPFSSAQNVFLSGPAEPVWMQEWINNANSQICPRCGLRPIPWTASRSGSSGDNACGECRRYRDEGARVMETLRHGKAEGYAAQAFGSISLKNNGDFWNMLETPDAEGDTRLCLVQGTMPLDRIYDGSFFNFLLSPPNEGKSWEKLLKDISPACQKILSGREDTSTHEALSPLLGSNFATAGDGWSSSASEENQRQSVWLRNIILSDPSLAGMKPEQAVLTWAARRHPSPSRLGRTIEQVQKFTRSAVALAQDIPFIPLTCDAGTFQVLVPASKTLEYVRAITLLYIECFGRVRHLLPLHLSASVFYHKAPLYIAMDAARRFRQIPDSPEPWTLTEYSAGQDSIRLTWELPDKRNVTWNIPSHLSSGEADLWDTWFQPADSGNLPVSLAGLQKDKKYRIRPSTFDFEVLDASTRRYDIRYLPGIRRRPHFMMPERATKPYAVPTPGPRPYPLEEVENWKSLESFFKTQSTQSQRKTALELLARLHSDWSAYEPAFKPMAADILINTMTQGHYPDEQLLNAAVDGTLFDLFEWYDFLAQKEQTK